MTVAEKPHQGPGRRKKAPAKPTFEDLPDELRKKIKLETKDGSITAERLFDISKGLENDPGDLATLTTMLEDAGVNVIDEAIGDPLKIEDEVEPRYTELDPLQIYIIEISKTPLIDGKTELAVGKRISDALAQISEIVKDTGLSSTELERYLPDAEGEAPPVKGADKKRLAKKAQELLAAKNEFAEAQRILIEANLRLVVSIAKRYAYHGLHLLDLINEGNLGLIRAVERFDYRRGFKFSTYASWWIRQSIRRAIADQGRIIRVPVHMSDSINRWIKASRSLSQKFGREPTLRETAKDMGISEPKLLEIMKVSQEPSSLEAPIMSAQDSSLAELVEDTFAISPYKAVLSLAFTEHLQQMLATLQEKEKRILELRFGLYGQEEHTLEEVGTIMGITRERVRQLELRALKKLRHLRLAEELFSMLAEMD